MNITLKDIPNNLHQRLRQRAESHGRSLNKEVLTILDSAVNPIKRKPQELLAQIEERRNRMTTTIDPQELEEIISEGRS